MASFQPRPVRLTQARLKPRNDSRLAVRGTQLSDC